MRHTVAASFVALVAVAGGISTANAATTPDLIGGLHLAPGRYGNIVLLDRMPQLSAHSRVLLSMHWGARHGVRR